MKKELKEVVKSIKKEFGEDAIMILGDKEPSGIEAVSSGSMLIDNALGVGGYPKGRIIEIFGPESSGKTTLALHAVSEVQKLGGIAAYIDTENAIDLGYAANLGVDTHNLLLSQPDSGEQALEIVDNLVKTNQVGIIVIDSVAALVPECELNGEMNDQTIGAQARLMSKALRKMASTINNANVIVIFINQLREKVGVIYGNPEVTSGGRALKFYSTIRIDIRRFDNIKHGTDVIGIRSRVNVIKNKVSPPFKKAEIDILYGKGIERTCELIEIASNKGIIDKSGAWYSYNGNKIGQGKDNVKKYLEENIDILNEIELKLLEIN